LSAAEITQRGWGGAADALLRSIPKPRFSLRLRLVNALENSHLSAADCSAIACRSKRHVRVVSAGSSGDCLPPSPPAEKAAARQDQTGESSTGDGAWYRHRRGIGHDCRTDITLRRERERAAVLGEVEDFRDRERLTQGKAGQRQRIGRRRRIVEVRLVEELPAASNEVVTEDRARTVAEEDLLGNSEAVLSGRHLVDGEPGRQANGTAGSNRTLPRRIEADVPTLGRGEAVIKRELERRPWSAQSSTQHVPSGRDHHCNDLGEAEPVQDERVTQ